MRIGVDITTANTRRTGIGYYAWELAKRLWMNKAPEDEMVFLFNSIRRSPPPLAMHSSLGKAVRVRHIPGPALLQMWKWMDRPPVEELAGPVDVFHSPATYIPPQQSGAAVTTVHDLHFLDSPDDPQSALGGEYLNWVLRKRLRDMHAVIVPSLLTRDSLLRHFGAEQPDLADRIHVMPWGVHKRFFGSPGREHTASVRACHALDRPYILCVGKSDERKNILTLQKAHSLLCERMPDCPTLAIAGSGAMAGTAGIHTRLLGYIREFDLAALYHAAEVFVCPSWMEGFGMPVVEAMAARVPVVVTQAAGCLEYLRPESALTVDPNDAEAMAAAIELALTDSALRKRMVESAVVDVSKLTWDACAKATLKVYETAIERAGVMR